MNSRLLLGLMLGLFIFSGFGFALTQDFRLDGDASANATVCDTANTTNVWISNNFTDGHVIVPPDVSKLFQDSIMKISVVEWPAGSLPEIIYATNQIWDIRYADTPIGESTFNMTGVESLDNVTIGEGFTPVASATDNLWGNESGGGFYAENFFNCEGSAPSYENCTGSVIIDVDINAQYEVSVYSNCNGAVSQGYNYSVDGGAQGTCNSGMTGWMHLGNYTTTGQKMNITFWAGQEYLNLSDGSIGQIDAIRLRNKQYIDNQSAGTIPVNFTYTPNVGDGLFYQVYSDGYNTANTTGLDNDNEERWIWANNLDNEKCPQARSCTAVNETLLWFIITALLIGAIWVIFKATEGGVNVTTLIGIATAGIATLVIAITIMSSLIGGLC